MHSGGKSGRERFPFLNREAVMLKAVAFDLDDTLLRDDLSISDYTLDVLNRLHTKGVLIIPASGRTFRSMLPFVQRLGCADYLISCNGAEIRSAASPDKLIFRAFFPPETMLKMIAFADKNNCYAQTYDEERFYYNRDGEYADLYARASVLKGTLVEDLAAFADRALSKMLLVDHPERIAALYDEATRIFRGIASVTCSKPYFLEFNPPEATKGLALKRIFEANGIFPSEAVAFGDSLNDLSMLSVCGRGICVQNARKELLSCCDEVCPSNQEDGVARFLEEQYL